MARLGAAWMTIQRGLAWHGRFRRGVTGQGMEHNQVGLGQVRHGSAWMITRLGKAWFGMVRQGMVRIITQRGLA